MRAPYPLLACLVGACQPEDGTTMTTATIDSGRWERTMATAVDGQRLSYRLVIPPEAARPDAGWPLLLFLHGAGERGADLSLVDVHGPARHQCEVPELARCVFVAPQCPDEAWWQSTTLAALVDEVETLTPIDASRRYVTGLSMGGYGTWSLIADRPDHFAAAVPVCGGGEIGRVWDDRTTGFAIERLLRARDLPIRAFHGADDDVIPAEESRLLVDALRAAGGAPELTVYPDVGHDSWTRTYADPELYRWLFRQRRGTEVPER